jgi:hypothetical protein
MPDAMTLVDPKGRPVRTHRAHYTPRRGATDAAIEEALARLYAGLAAAGGPEPTREELFDACLLNSMRVLDVRDRMRADGRLPALRRRDRARQARPHAGHRPRPRRPPPAPAYPLEPVVREHLASERRLGLAGMRGVP